MGRLAERLAATSPTTPLLWLDFLAYARRLLLGGRDIPWTEPADFINFHRQAQRLLQPDVVTLPLAEFLTAYLHRHPELRARQVEKRRLAHPLKVLLGAEGARALLQELAQAMRESYPALVLAVAVPLPRHWLCSTYQAAHAAAPAALTTEDVDAAAMYAADFLRLFANADIDVLLLAGAGDASSADLEPCAPMRNLAEHYRWDKAALLTSGAFAAENGLGLDVLLSPGGSGRVSLLPDSFWSERETMASAARLYYATVPTEAEPEQVLERLAGLRAARSS